MSRIRRALVAMSPVILNGGLARRFLLAGTTMALAFAGLAGPLTAPAAPAAPPTFSPPDPSATTNGRQILMAVNLAIGVRDNAGNVLCGGATPLSQLLNTSEPLTDPRVEYDNVNHRFILIASVLTFAPFTN